MKLQKVKPEKKKRQTETITEQNVKKNTHKISMI